MLLYFSPIKGGNTSIMWTPCQIAFLLPDLHDQKLLTLRRRSFSRWGRERFAFFFASKGCQYCCYFKPLLNYFIITRLIRPKIVDTLLMLTIKMGQGACCLFFLPINDGNTSIMYNHYWIVCLLPYLQDQKSLKLCWHSFSRWDTERLAFFYVYKGCQYCCYV